MTKNMGTTDRVLRIAAAGAIAALYLTGSISGLPAAVLGAIAALFIVTSVIGFCPAYVLFGISTRKAPADSIGV